MAMLRAGEYKQIAPVLFGSGMAGQAGEKAKGLGISHILLIHDEGVKDAGILMRIKKTLLDAGIQVTEWDGVQTDCPDQTVEEAVHVVETNQADGILGIGGGSVLDTAKAVAATAANGIEVLDDIPAYLSGEKQYKNHPLPLILIPTTAGTGSESTFVAVVTSSRLDAKIGFPCSADYAIVDPELTRTVPPYITAFTGMDALSHANEALTERKNTPHSDLLAYEVIRLVKNYLPQAVEDGNYLEARECLAFASNLAGISFNEAGVHIGHSAAHALGHLYHIPHGVCCANLTPAVIRIQAYGHPEKMKRLGNLMGANIQSDCPEEIGRSAAQAVGSFVAKLGIPSFKGQGLTWEQVKKAAPIVVGDPLAYAYDGQVTEEKILELLKYAYEETY